MHLPDVSTDSYQPIFFLVAFEGRLRMEVVRPRHGASLKPQKEGSMPCGWTLEK